MTVYLYLETPPAMRFCRHSEFKRLGKRDFGVFYSQRLIEQSYLRFTHEAGPKGTAEQMGVAVRLLGLIKRSGLGHPCSHAA